MKNGLLVLNFVLLIAVGILFYFHFSSNKTPVAKTTGTSVVAQPSNGSCRMAYFIMDSVESSFAMVKEVKSELNKKEDAITNELSRMDRDYRSKAAQYQAQAVNMNQTQSESAQKDMMQTQQSMQTRKQQMEQEYQDYQMRKLKEVRTRIEDFLKDYNKSRTYSYIVSYEPGMIYYKDSAYNITGDVVKGLNELYKQKK